MQTRLLVVGLLLASALVTVLAVQKRDLRDEVSQMRRQADFPHPGLTLPTFHTTTLDGDSITIGQTDGRRQLLLFFSTTCGNCLVTLPEWRRIHDAVRDSSSLVQVVGITLDPEMETREYVTTHDLEFPIVTFPAPKLIALYHANGVPLSVISDSVGVVTHARLGSITSDSITPRTPGADSLIAIALGCH